MFTRESGSSTQSTGTSWMRSPRRWASTSSSVSKNQPLSWTSSISVSSTSRRTALKPHCASLNFARRTVRRMRLYEREMNSRFGPRTTREPVASRDPIARSLWPESSGATSGSSPRRSVERSTSMYATTRAGLPLQAARSARPRPFCSSRR